MGVREGVNLVTTALAASEREPRLVIQQHLFTLLSDVFPQRADSG